MRFPETLPLLFTLLMPCAAAAGQSSAYLEFDGERFRQGRVIWLDNCEGCHGYGIAGAPIPMKPADWEARLARGKEVLYGHAINGFFGPDDTMMPERGGNPELSDDQVRSAVDYMTELARWYIQHREEKR